MKFGELIYSKNPICRRIFRLYCSLLGSDIPCSIKVGKGIKFPHGIKGIIMHRNTIIGDNVTLYYQVTCGMGVTSYPVPVEALHKKSYIQIKDGAIVCCGAKIICNKDCIIVGKNTIIGANSVLTKSTGDNEVWAGVPAKLIKKRMMA